MRRSLAIALVLVLPSCARAQERRPHPRLLLSTERLETLAKRARERRPQWQALEARCDKLARGAVEWPDGNAYPDGDGIGGGYQGDSYRDAVEDLGLCHQVARLVGGPRAVAYGQKGVDVLLHMSEPTGPHAPEPLHDSGYGIRNYGVGMALGYDWLHDQLTADERVRVYTALNRWIAAYRERGFGRGHPQGNYFAGAYAAQALAALATDGENPEAPTQWDDFRARLHGTMVQPYYASHLAGGGWPEGWTYGPLATLNMVWPSLAAASARGLDLVHEARAPFPFPVDQARYLMHFTWPSRRTLDTRGTHHPGKDPSATSSALFVPMAGALEALHDPLAPVFHRYAREVRAARKDAAEAWQEMLFWDEDAPEAEVAGLPLSDEAQGMQTVAMRSGWDTGAVWASFTAGTYVGSPDSGEMGFDQGSLGIVVGDTPLLCDAAPTLLRHTPGTEDGDLVEDRVYNDGFGDNDKDPLVGNRTLYNVFYARARHYGQIAAGPDEARTRLGAFEDGGGYVFLRGDHLEEMYRKPRGGPRPVARWTRRVVYLRPSLFVVEDRTRSAAADTEQWMAFHFAGRPTDAPPEGTPPAGPATHRFEVVAGDGLRGVVTTLLPAGHLPSVVDVYERHRVFRLEVRPGHPGVAQRWLTVIDATRDRARVERALPIELEPGAVEGEVAGTLLRGQAESRAVIFADGDGAPSSGLRYRTGAERTRHFVVGLRPGQRYQITTAELSAGRAIRVTLGVGPTASGAGVLEFEVATDGHVDPAR